MSTVSLLIFVAGLNGLAADKLSLSLFIFTAQAEIGPSWKCQSPYSLASKGRPIGGPDAAGHEIC